MKWGDELVALFRALWMRPELSTKDMADILGVSKSAIVGTAYRHDFPDRPRAEPSPIPEPRVEPPEEPHQDGRPPGRYPIAGMTLPPLPSLSETTMLIELEATKPPGAKPAVVNNPAKIGQRHCQFIIGEARDRLFCDQVAVGIDKDGREHREGAVWCPEHRAVVYAPEKERRSEFWPPAAHNARRTL